MNELIERFEREFESEYIDIGTYSHNIDTVFIDIDGEHKELFKDVRRYIIDSDDLKMRHENYLYESGIDFDEYWYLIVDQQ